ncbi:MAG: hypothetical protein GXP50_05735 [Deltaproteobacteria bacterium]|nr:hypothetical protein [Deltaproteobacteria bacterium]
MGAAVPGGRTRAALIAALAVGLAAGSAAGALVDALVGRVDGYAVTWSEIRREAAIRKLEGRPEAERGARVVRDALVRRRLFVAEAQRLRLEASDEEIDAELRALSARCGRPNPELCRLLGLDPEHLRLRERQEVLARKYLAFRKELTFVPLTDVMRFIRENGDRLSGSSPLDLRGEVRDYLLERKFRKELEEWIREQVKAGRVELLPLPEEKGG